MRLLHIINNLSTGGAEIMLCKLLQFINKTEFENRVVSLIERGTVGSAIESLGIQVDAVGMKRGMLNPTALWKLIKIIQEFNPDLIQGWMYHGSLAAQFVSLFTARSLPVVWNIRHSLYSLEYEKYTTRSSIRILNQFSNLPQNIIYNSTISSAQHEQFGYCSSKTVVIPNGFDIETFKPSLEFRQCIRTELGLPENAFLIGRIGRYHSLKDYPTFLYAASILVKEYPNVHFVMAGRDVDKKNQVLISLLKDLAIIDRVHMLGERTDIPRITAALDAACSSSYSEAFPNVIGEAMSCEIPCVVTDVGDSACIVGDTGAVVPPGNPNALATALGNLIEIGTQARQKQGQAARQRIKEGFSLPKIVEEYEKLYLNVGFKN